MMKYNAYIAAFLLLFAMGSCTDLIDIEPKDSLTEDLVFSTIEGLEGSVLGIYERGRNPYESNDVSTWKIAGTDLVQAGSHIADQTVVQSFNAYNFQLNAQNSGVRDLWNSRYGGLYRANVLLKSLEALAVDESNANKQARKDALKGVALYFRAYFHFDLVQRWDNIVIVTDAPDVVEYDVELSPKSAVYAQIEEDLLAAIELLPETASADGNGSVSKGVARHVLSKVYLDMGEWSKAAGMASAVISDGAYALQPLEEIFHEDHQDNKEVIFAWQFSNADVDRPSRTVQQMIPLYDRINGVTRTFDYGGRPWARLYPSEYLMSLYAPNDKRLAAWYVTEYRYNDEENLPEGVELGDVVTPEDVLAQGGDLRHITPTTNKYWESDALGRVLGDAQGFKNVIEYRLAEAYLIAAEAVMRDAGATGSLSGELAGMSAAGIVNVLRERADVEPFTTLDETKLLEEHARELAHEGHRWNMLKRLGILVDRADQYNTPGAQGNIQPYHTAWPIPENFVQLTGVQQNPGYVN